MLATIKINDTLKADIRVFRDENPLESLSAYVESDLIPFCLEHCAEMMTLRCSLSGWRIGTYAADEVAVAIRQSVPNSELGMFQDILHSFTVRGFISAIEHVIDMVSLRTLLLARPAPMFVGAIGKPAIESVPRNRQLITLLNQLVYDNGQLRARHNDSIETINRLRKSARLADRIASMWDGVLDTSHDNAFQDLYSGLVELDAKWQISKLKLTAKEEEKLEAIRNANDFNLGALRSLIWAMIVHRDKYVEANPTEGWTRQAYRDVTMAGYDSAMRRSENSNVLHPAKPSEINAVKGVRPAASQSKKTASKSKNPKTSMFANIWGSL